MVYSTQDLINQAKIVRGKKLCSCGEIEFICCEKTDGATRCNCCCTHHKPPTKKEAKKASSSYIEGIYVNYN